MCFWLLILFVQHCLAQVFDHGLVSRRFQVVANSVCLIAMIALSGSARSAALAEIDPIVSALANPQQFKDQFVEPCTPATTSYPLETPQDLCYCSSPSFQQQPYCVPSACGRGPQMDCLEMLSAACMCDYTWYQYSCTPCQVSSLPSGPALAPFLVSRSSFRADPTWQRLVSDLHSRFFLLQYLLNGSCSAAVLSTKTIRPEAGNTHSSSPLVAPCACYLCLV